MTTAVGRRSPDTTLTLRLLAMLLLILAVVVACFAVAARLVIASVRAQQLQDARDYFAQRIRTMDEGWRLTGFAVGQQLMLWQAEPGHANTTPDVAEARLRTLLVTLTDQGDFSHVLLVDGDGRTLLAQGSRSQDRPALPPTGDRQGLDWVWSEADRTIYRTVSMPLKLGPQVLRMLLYFPIDNALLARMVYPQSHLDLLHGGAVRATASAVEAASRALLQGAPATDLPWDARAGAPVLRVQRPVAPPLSDGQLLAMLAAGALGFVGAGWWVLGRWVRQQARRLWLLREAATGFAVDGALTTSVARRLDGAAEDRHRGDDIHQLADGLRAMMLRIDQARADQRRDQAALAALNAGLEERVQARTRELEVARDDALAAGRAKEQFLSSMSHEIRTPMNGMLGALDLMATTQLDAEQQRYTEVAAASGAALMAVLDNVLDFAKIGAGRLQLLHAPMDVLAVGLSVTTLFAASAQRKGLALRLEADPRLAGWRLGDAMRLRQVLLNLVGNAMKFTQRGEVVLALREGRSGEPPDALHFSVRDTGPGIAEADQARIFQPFVQGEVPGPREDGGTGLGLAISSQLVQAMGGTLVLHSHPGQGASFAFCLQLPRAAAPPSPALPLANGVPAQLHGQVLLVEDNPVNRLVAIAMLERLGLQVLAAEQGEEALAHLTLPAAGLRAVLMDCQMPVLDGYETTRRLRELEQQQRRPRLPVIALTANALSGDVQRCFAAGMDAHLTKPFTLQQLHAALAPWCGPPPVDAAGGRMLGG
ncbi:MAG TPA: ATP-binding protein [Aquabacterium sp.]|nr:ATP-binding protein [Aquabacterium sp.]